MTFIAVVYRGRSMGCEAAIAPPPDGCWPKTRDARSIKSRFILSPGFLSSVLLLTHYLYLGSRFSCNMQQVNGENSAQPEDTKMVTLRYNVQSPRNFRWGVDPRLKFNLVKTSEAKNDVGDKIFSKLVRHKMDQPNRVLSLYVLRIYGRVNTHCVLSSIIILPVILCTINENVCEQHTGFEIFICVS